jgi:hypothetical protein
LQHTLQGHKTHGPDVITENYNIPSLNILLHFRKQHETMSSANTNANTDIVNHCVSCDYCKSLYFLKSRQLLNITRNQRKINCRIHIPRLQIVAVTKLHASKPQNDFTPPPFLASLLSQQYSVASFAALLVLSCLHSPAFRC